MSFEITIHGLSYKEREQLIEKFELVEERKFHNDLYQLTLLISEVDLEEIGNIIVDYEYAELDLNSLADGKLEIFLEET